MSVASITITDAPLDCSFGRTTRPVSPEAMLYLCSRVVISITGIYVARVINTYTETSDAYRGPLFGEIKQQDIHGCSFW